MADQLPPPREPDAELDDDEVRLCAEVAELVGVPAALLVHVATVCLRYLGRDRFDLRPLLQGVADGTAAVQADLRRYLGDPELN